jgi:hypothetical protein
MDLFEDYKTQIKHQARSYKVDREIDRMVYDCMKASEEEKWLKTARTFIMERKYIYINGKNQLG